MSEGPIRRLHWGCGSRPATGWINSDMLEHPGVELSCDIRRGLPLSDGEMDYISSQHALQELEIGEQLPALLELRRVLKPGGVLRLCLPDLDRAIDAYRAGQEDFFYSWDWTCIDGNFVTHILWHGATKMLYTYDFAAELLATAGFHPIQRVGFRETSSRYPEIVDLDDRERESFFIEAFK